MSNPYQQFVTPFVTNIHFCPIHSCLIHICNLCLVHICNNPFVSNPYLQFVYPFVSNIHLCLTSKRKHTTQVVPPSITAASLAMVFINCSYPDHSMGMVFIHCSYPQTSKKGNGPHARVHGSHAGKGMVFIYCSYPQSYIGNS